MLIYFYNYYCEMVYEQTLYNHFKPNDHLDSIHFINYQKHM